MPDNVVILGAGCAGLSAAIYAAREGFNPLVISGPAYGGQLMLTTLVENYPGFPEGVNGPDLMLQMKKQAEKFGTRFVEEEVEGVDFSTRPFRIKTSSNSYEALSVIIATGASARMLGLPSESKYIGGGLSTCATCDAAFYKNKDVVVVGGGDTAVGDADFLTRFAKSVTVIHRRNEFRASKIMQEKLLKNVKVKVMWDSVIEEILGNNNKVNGVRVKNVKTNETQVVRTDGIFMGIGNAPNTKFLAGKLKLDERGYVIAKDEVFTDIEGVFVAGDVSDGVYMQAVTAASGGVKAALQMRGYLSRLGTTTK